MSDISPLTRIELLLDKITTWQRLGPRGALLYQEIESVRRDRELLGADGLYLRRRPDLDPDEAKDVEDCTAALRDIAQHGDAVTSYVEGAGIPSGPLALFVRTPDFSLIPGALEVLCRARAVAPPQDTPVGEETATDDATPDESTAEDDAEDDPPPGKIPPERRTILLTKEEAALARRPGRGSVPRAGGGDRPGD